MNFKSFALSVAASVAAMVLFDKYKQSKTK